MTALTGKISLNDLRRVAGSHPPGYVDEVIAMAAERGDGWIRLRQTDYDALRERYKVSRGLGDTIDKITTATGIKAAVKAVAGDCGCGERQGKLNRLLPYRQRGIEGTILHRHPTR